MIDLHFIKYDTMNSWNNSTAPAFNLKIYNVIPREYRDKVYEVIRTEEYWNEVKNMIRDFSEEWDYQWQAGFNGRSGGYLVLYTGSKRTTRITEKDFEKKNHVYVTDGIGWKSKEQVEKMGIMNKEIITGTFIHPGKSINFEEVSNEVLDSFKLLATNIVQTAINYCKDFKVVDEEYTVVKTRKAIKEKV